MFKVLFGARLVFPVGRAEVDLTQRLCPSIGKFAIHVNAVVPQAFRLDLDHVR